MAPGATRHPTTHHRHRAAAALALVALLVAVVAWVLRTEPEDRVVAAARPSPEVTSPSTTAPPPPPTTAPDGPAHVEVLTPDGTDAYVVSRAHGGVGALALGSNRGGNLRVVVTGEAAPSADQEVCAVWSGPVEGTSQPGLALRVRDGRGGTAQAITVTNNVFGQSRWVWNVHLWLHPHVWRVASVELPGALVRTTREVAPLPWHLCARTIGPEVTFVVWTGDGPAPRWEDPIHGATVTLPEGWVFEGRPGVYAGHLPAGGATSYDRVVARPLDTEAGRRAPRPG